MAKATNQTNDRRDWVKPEVIEMSAKGPTMKLNQEPSERSRSGISYAPS